MKKIFLQLVLTAFLSTLLLIPSGAAQFQDDSGAGQPVFCDGYRDWSTFISSTISYDGFVEYWDDILIRYNVNFCHYTDIDNMLKRINKARAQIRDAFYACADTTRMKKTYYELEAELFFLRNYIDADNGQFLVVDDQKIINDMRDFFVLNKGLFTDKEILDLFNRFKARYKSKLDTYKNCKDPSWGALVEKWNQFKKDAGGIAPALQQAKESIEKRWDRMAKAPWRHGDDFFGGFVDARINGLPPAEGWQQITEELEKNFPQGYTFDQLQAAKVQKESNLQYFFLEEQYLAQYQAQYAESSDTYTAEIIKRLMNLQILIEQTYPFQNQTIQCTRGIKDKQC